MSEYQYYEFQAIDRPLSEREGRVLRACSTRATITSTRFVNHYEWGDLKGDLRRTGSEGWRLLPTRSPDDSHAGAKPEDGAR